MLRHFHPLCFTCGNHSTRKGIYTLPNLCFFLQGQILVVISCIKLSEMALIHQSVLVFHQTRLVSDIFHFNKLHHYKSSNNKCYVTFILFVLLVASISQGKETTINVMSLSSSLFTCCLHFTSKGNYNKCYVTFILFVLLVASISQGKETTINVMSLSSSLF